MTAKLDGSMLMIFHTVLGSTATRGGMYASHTKNPTIKKKERTNGAMNAAEPQPSMGPWVRPRMKQMRKPIMSTTPGMSRSFHLETPVGVGAGGVQGRRRTAQALKDRARMATRRKNQW
jgi:hypothetical protein